MKKTFVLAWATLMLTGTSYAIEKANAAPVQKDFTSAKSTVPAPQDTARGGELRTYKVKLGGGKDKQVQIFMFNSTVEIVGHNGDDVIIETRDYSNPPQRAEGLKPLYNQVEDNTKLGLSVTKESNTLTIAKASRNQSRYTIRVPKNASVVYKETNWTGGNLSITDIDGELELKLNNASATINNVSGPIVANTTNGALNIRFSSLDQSKPNAISTINGAIDITLPADTKANFRLKSLQGEIYTDFDMSLNKQAKSNLTMIGGGGNIEGKINGGGTEMSIQTINSEIYIRKKK